MAGPLATPDVLPDGKRPPGNHARAGQRPAFSAAPDWCGKPGLARSVRASIVAEPPAAGRSGRPCPAPTVCRDRQADGLNARYWFNNSVIYQIIFNEYRYSGGRNFHAGAFRNPQSCHSPGGCPAACAVQSQGHDGAMARPLHKPRHRRPL